MRGRAMAAVAVSTLGIMAGPGTAVAADNQPPSQPLVSELKTDFTACATGADAPYVGQPPVLTAVLRDPDAVPPVAVMLTAEFEMWWQDAQGEEQRRSFSPSYQSPSGSVQRWQVPSDIPADTPISWRARASDGTAWSPWSSEGEGFGLPSRVRRRRSAEGGVVTSSEYPERRCCGWTEWASTVTSLMDSPSEDVVGPTGTASSRGPNGTRPGRTNPGGSGDPPSPSCRSPRAPTYSDGARLSTVPGAKKWRDLVLASS